MATVKKKIDLFNSPEGTEIRQALISIEQTASFKTGPSYSANGETYPNHLIPFVEKHLLYLSKHPEVNPEQYLSNLRLMLRGRAG